MSGAAPASEAAADLAVSVLVPVYGSGGLAETTAARIFAALRDCGSVELLFCDDGSPDDSLAQLEKLATVGPDRIIRVLQHANRGLAFTLRRLIREARGPVCVYLDMDLSFDVSELPHLIDLLDRYDVVVGSKYVGDAPRRVPRLRQVCSVAFRWLVHLLSGTRVKDVGSGMVAFKRAPVSRLGLSSEGFAIHAELLDRAHLAGLSVTEVPVSYAHTPGSFDVLRHGFVAVRDLLAYRLRRHRHPC